MDTFVWIAQGHTQLQAWLDLGVCMLSSGIYLSPLLSSALFCVDLLLQVAPASISRLIFQRASTSFPEPLARVLRMTLIGPVWVT